MRIVKYLFAIAVVLLTAQPALAAMSAREIMQAVDDRDDGDNRTADMKMVLIDKNGDERVRAIHSFDKDKGKDKQRIMFFLSPADVKDTGFLTYDYDAYDKDDDQWLYLPALRKSKRIASSDKSGSFMGSDFNYADMTRRNLDDYEFKIIKEDKVRGENVWLIESKPKSRKVIDETGYEKAVLFVRQDNFVVVRAVNWVGQSDNLKYMDVEKLKKIDGVWTILQMSMTTKRGKSTLHKTNIFFDNVKYNQNLSDDMFTIRRLEKGL
jgi:outer membrane lipoprotein-sorting protein